MVEYVSVDGRLVVLSAIHLGSPRADTRNPTRDDLNETVLPPLREKVWVCYMRGVPLYA